MPGNDFVLVTSCICIFMLQHLSLTRNGSLFCTNYLILLLTLNNKIFIVQNHTECGALKIRSKSEKILIYSELF